MSTRATDLPLAQMRADEESDESFSQAGLYRSVDDVRMLRRVSIAALVQSLLLIISIGVIAFLATRPVEQVIVERTSEGDRVVAINGKSVAAGYAIGEDRPRAGDKKTLAREWSAARYGIDPITRERDIARIYTFMHPDFAKGYSQLMTKRGEFETEARERRQAVWTPQVIEVDRADPYKVKVVGTWDVMKRAESGTGMVRELKQLMFTLQLIEDTDKGRAPRNANTGFLIGDILDYKELNLPAPATASVVKAEAQTQ